MSAKATTPPATGPLRRRHPRRGPHPTTSVLLGLAAIVAAVVPAGAARDTGRSFYLEDFEGASSDFTSQILLDSGAATGFALVTDDAHAGAQSAYVEDQSETKDAVFYSTALTGGPDTIVSFWHRYSLEADADGYYDGAVFEYSTDGGTAWFDITAIATENTYDGVLEDFFGNPLGGREAWSGFAQWRQEVFHLGDRTGSALMFRFRHASDDLFGDDGWWIDDFEFQTNDGAPTPTPTLSPTPGPTSTPTPTPDPSVEAYSGWVNSEQGCWCGRLPNSLLPASYVIKGKNASPADREAARDMVDYWDTFVNLYSSSVDNSDTLGAPGNGTNEVNVFISSADSTSIYGISMSSDTYGVAALVPDASFGSFNECQDFSAVGCAAYTETDVVVNLNFSAGWTSDWWTDDNSPALVQTTVLHEVGHTLGLHHIFSLPQYGDSFSTLNYINDDSGRYVTRMDSLTAFTEYPAQAARASLVDVGVHNFVFGNSTYAETYATRNPATVQRGQNLTISNYLVQSPGSVAAPNVAVTWYLSADTTIATSDYVLGVADFSTLSANSETDQNVQLPVPMTIPDGVYYIGAIITTGGQQDAVTWNNVAILGHGARLQVTVSGGGSVDPTATATRTPGQGTPSATATRTPTSGSSTPSATPTTTRTSTPSPTRTPTPDLPVSYSGWVNNEQGCWCGRFPNSALPAAYVVKGKDATSADREAARSMIDYWDRFVNIYDTSVDNSNVLGTPGNGTNEVNVFISAAESTTIYGISMDANTYGVAAMVPDAAFGAFNECQSFSATGCNQFTETDVVINADFGSGWTSDWWNDGGSPALVQTTALHEVGHTVGLHHIFTLPAFGDSYSTMNYINDDSGKFVTRMDSKTVFAEYPAQAQRAALVDVGVYSFVFGNNQYGETYATRAPASLPRGQNLTISNYMVQSAGSIAASNVVVSWYLSTDVDVPAGDFLLGTVELGALNPDTESDLNAMLPVPQYVPDGTYYIGALIRVAGSEDTVGHNNVTLLGHGTRLTVQVSGGGAVDPTPTPTPTPQATPSPTQPAAVPVGEGGQWALLLVLMSAGLAVAYRLGRRKEAWSRHTTA